MTDGTLQGLVNSFYSDPPPSSPPAQPAPPQAGTASTGPAPEPGPGPGPTLDTGPGPPGISIVPQGQPDQAGGPDRQPVDAKPPPKPDLSGPDSYIAYAPAVEITESGGHQFGKDGKVLTSKKGARGVMQLEPDSFPGVNIDDENTNRSAGTAYLRDLYAKYQNWPHALAAWNWGEGHTDKWLAEGGNVNKLPADTVNFISDVQFRVGSTDNQANAVQAIKRDLGGDSLDDALESLNSGSTDESTADKYTTTLPRPSDVGTDFAIQGMGEAPAEVNPPDEEKAAFTGFRRGAMDIVEGPAQKIGMQINEDATRAITQARHTWEQQFEGPVKEHPWIYNASYLAGMVTSSLAAAKLLEVGAGLTTGTMSAYAAISRGLKVLPLIVRAGIGGSIANLTRYKDDLDAPDFFERFGHEFGIPEWLTDTTVGFGGGLLGYGVAHSIIGAAKTAAIAGQATRQYLTERGQALMAYGGKVNRYQQSVQDYASKAAQRAADVAQREAIATERELQILRRTANSAAFQRAMAQIKDTLSTFSRDFNGLRDAIRSAYQNAEQEARRLYDIRNEAGDRIEGFDIDGFAAANDAARDSHGEHGVALEPGVPNAHDQVEEILGIKEEMRKRAEHAAAMEKWKQDRDAALRSAGGPVVRGRPREAPGPTPQVVSVDEYRRLIGTHPDSPFIPQQPEPHVSATVSGDQLSTALSRLNSQLRRTPYSNRAKRRQLITVIKALEGEAARQASELGMSTQEFTRKMIRARDNWKKTVLPFHQEFGGKSSRELFDPETGMTAVDAYDHAVGILKTADPEKIDRLARTLGPHAKDMLGNTLLHWIVTDAQKGSEWSREKFAASMNKYGPTLFKLLGHDKALQLKGATNLIQQISIDTQEKLPKVPPMPRELGAAPKEPGALKLPKEPTAPKVAKGHLSSWWLNVIAMEHLARGVIHGDIMSGMEGAALYAGSGVFGHAMGKLMHDLPEKLPGAGSVLARAAKMEPGSKELHDLSEQIAQRYRRAVAMGLRQAQKPDYSPGLQLPPSMGFSIPPQTGLQP